MGIPFSFLTMSFTGSLLSSGSIENPEYDTQDIRETEGTVHISSGSGRMPATLADAYIHLLLCSFIYYTQGKHGLIPYKADLLDNNKIIV